MGGWQGGRVSIDFFWLWMELEFLEPAGTGLQQESEGNIARAGCFTSGTFLARKAKAQKALGEGVLLCLCACEMWKVTMCFIRSQSQNLMHCRHGAGQPHRTIWPRSSGESPRLPQSNFFSTVHLYTWHLSCCHPGVRLSLPDPRYILCSVVWIEQPS